MVIHAGAYTAVDACESDPDTAFAVNALGTRHVAEASGRVGAHVLYVSTDYVFDGDADRPYVEWDAPNPRSVYGRSKLGGEIEVARHCPGATVVRTAWVSGAHGANMVKTVLRAGCGRPRRTAQVRRRSARLPHVHCGSGPGHRPVGPRTTVRGPST